MIVGQELTISLGKPVLMTGFDDGEARYCYPFTLGELDEIQAYLSIIDDKDYRKNVNDKAKMQSIATLFIRAFHLQEDEFQEFMLSAIGVESYPLIMSDIKRISGLESGSSQNDDNDDNKDVLDWDVSFAVIASRTGYTYQDISNMTLPQFNNVMEAIAKDINWNQKLATIGFVKEPDGYITDEEHPLYSNKKEATVVNGKRVTTMKDIQNLI
nr:MAG TPA: hypothetical protein [Caudoviricetes sp.]